MSDFKSKFEEVKNIKLLDVENWSIIVSIKQNKNTETKEVYDEKICITQKKDLYLKWVWKVQKEYDTFLTIDEFKAIQSIELI